MKSYHKTIQQYHNNDTSPTSHAHYVVAAVAAVGAVDDVDSFDGVDYVDEVDDVALNKCNPVAFKVLSLLLKMNK